MVLIKIRADVLSVLIWDQTAKVSGRRQKSTPAGKELMSFLLWNIFYIFSHDAERDVFNEKPSKEEQASATQVIPKSIFTFPYGYWCFKDA